MRYASIVSMVALAACSNNGATGEAQQSAPSGNAEVAAKAALTPDQEAARQVATEYLALLSKGDYAKARRLWDRGGAASGGSVADLRRAYSGFSSFEGRAEEASPVSTTSGVSRVVVTASARAVMKKTGEERDMTGFIYLQRPANESAWRIWGVDVRRRH